MQSLIYPAKLSKNTPIIESYRYVNGAADLSNSDIMYQVTTQDYCQYKLSK